MLSISSFSQTILKNTLRITKDSLVLVPVRQIKLTNKIFLEHKEFCQLIESYKKQTSDMMKTLNTYNQITSNQQKQISLLKAQTSVLSNDLLSKDKIITEKDLILKNKQNKLKRTRKTLIPITICFGALFLWMMMK